MCVSLNGVEWLCVLVFNLAIDNICKKINNYTALIDCVQAW